MNNNNGKDSSIQVITEGKRCLEEYMAEKFVEGDVLNGNEKSSNILIVYDNEGKEAPYAQLLFQLIGQMKNIDSSQPITESEYRKSFATIDTIPQEKVLFFGNGKEAASQGKAIDWRYDKFGMKYGWLGNRCVISADPDKITLKEQNPFGEYYNSCIEQFKNLDVLNQISYTKVEESDMNDLYNEIKFENSDDPSTKAGKIASAIVGSPIILLALGFKALGDSLFNGMALFERKELWKRQYELLICEFLLNGLENYVSNIGNKVSKDQMIVVYDPKDAEYAHLLHNLVQQYSGYDIAEYTEKMFIDNAKSLSSKNKIIFLGTMKCAKERSVALHFKYSVHGMRYGWIGNHCFVDIKTLKPNERSDFIKFYSNKAIEYENKAKVYKKHEDSKIGKNVAIGLNIINAPVLLFGLPGFLVRAGAKTLAGFAADKIIDNLKNISDFVGYQYHLLLREFVFNGLSDFMGE